MSLAQDSDTAPASGRSSGGRGCGTNTLSVASDVPALILLTPGQQAGKTISTRPTFAWFVRDAASLPIEFRLYEQDNDRFKLVKEIKDDRLRSVPGIMLMSAGGALPELTIGKRYRWQVELVCNPSRPSSNLFAEAVIEVVPLQAGLKTQLAQTRDRVNQAKLYAQANLWYDVLKTAFTPPSSATQLHALRQSLLNSVAIDATECKLLQDSSIHAIQR
ncbi:DUF928 domain-containing protein [Stenomitos frigidus]|uniref:DUF928 domain-containing protein n=1 Tax=Stenomitos frigidus TaxID=1886765 RepID=UPI0015E6E68E|nr:DUF928 domain-containing protein [Stenomitos frigidus]